jgi:ATP-dependent DNA helicase RecG
MRCWYLAADADGGRDRGAAGNPEPFAQAGSGAARRSRPASSLRYEDETRITAIAEAPLGVPVQLEVRLLEVTLRLVPRRQLLLRVCDARAEDSLLDLRFLSFYGSQQRALEAARGCRLRLFGEVRCGFDGLEMVHPRYRVVADDEPLPQSLTPLYPTTAGLTQTVLRRLIMHALRQVDLAEVLEENWCSEQALPSFATAVSFLHAPPPAVSEAALENRTHPAWRRIKFDELLAQQLSLRRAYLARRHQGRAGPACRRPTRPAP